MYSTALRLMTPAYFARLWWRGAREPEYRAHWAERLGFASSSSQTADSRGHSELCWVHAVSLGETRAASSLLAALREIHPGLRVLLTHSTATGREAGRSLLRPGDVQAWLPYDTPGAVRRFLSFWQPRVGVLMETEVWPNLLLQAQARGIPMVLANARLSAKSLRQGQRWRAVLAPAVKSLRSVLAQTGEDAQRFESFGAQGIEVSGNLKFDAVPPANLLQKGRAWQQSLMRPVVLAASTREGEEAGLLKAWRALPGPRPLLLLVPRHPQRFDEVAALVPQAGLSMQRRSAWDLSPPATAAQADVWLGDSLGEMPLYYAAAHVALLGGSFAPLGGQNLIEAAACGCPVIMGPHTFNFSQAADQAVQAQAAWRVGDIEEGVRVAVEQAMTMAAGASSHTAVERALKFAQAHRGAALRQAQVINRLGWG